MLTVNLKGGLGNQLFQLAAAETIASQAKSTFFLSGLKTPETHHSKENYFTSIFSRWKHYILAPLAYTVVHETNPYHKEDYTSRISNKIVCLDGYFQRYDYISPNFCSRLTFDTSILQKYPQHKDVAFLHIRGGDYVNHWLHDISLDSYYTRAIAEFPANTHFYIFTNDVSYAKTRAFLTTIPHTFIEENEVNSLYLMSQCGIGGICANSSFSWWGAYLNRNRILTLPSKWFNGDSYYTEGYYFDGCRRIEV
jgi:hypothetical protein